MDACKQAMESSRQEYKYKTRVCKYISDGRACLNGANCPFTHPDTDDVTTQALEVAAEEKKQWRGPVPPPSKGKGQGKGKRKMLTTTSSSASCAASASGSESSTRRRKYGDDEDESWAVIKRMKQLSSAAIANVQNEAPKELHRREEQTDDWRSSCLQRL